MILWKNVINAYATVLKVECLKHGVIALLSMKKEDGMMQEQLGAFSSLKDLMV